MPQLHQEWLDAAEARFHEWLWAVGEAGGDGKDTVTCICKSPQHHGTHAHKYPQSCGNPAKFRFQLHPKNEAHSPRNWCQECTTLWVANEPKTTSVMP